MKDDIKLIFENYLKSKTLSEDNDEYQYAPDEAPEDDTLPTIPLDGEDEEDLNVRKISDSLEAIANELKQLNTYVDFLATGTRARGFTAQDKIKDS